MRVPGIAGAAETTIGRTARTLRAGGGQEFLPPKRSEKQKQIWTIKPTKLSVKIHLGRLFCQTGQYL